MSLPNIQELDKLKIIAYKDSKYSEQVGEPFLVQFNPSEYNLSYEIEWENTQAENQTDGEQKFKRIKPSDLRFGFTLDGTGATGEKITVQDKIDELFNLAYNYQSEQHKPNYLKVIWGKLEFRGVLQNISLAHSLFMPNGEPLRTKVDLTIQSHKDAETQVAQNQPASPDLTHVRTVKDGDTLPLLSYQIYGDSRYYPDLAKVNGIINFRSLETGKRLYFPPIKELKP